MLYAVGSYLGEPAAAPAATQICQDAVDIVTGWDVELLTVCRRTNSYDASGLATESWPAVGTFNGDWQPVSGRVSRDEEGLQIKSDAFIIAPCSADVEAGDRIYRAAGTFEYVNYVKTYKGHQTIYLTKTMGSQ